MSISIAHADGLRMERTLLPSARPCHERFESPLFLRSGLIKGLMPAVQKLPGKKAQTPKMLSAVARQQLLLINGLLDEVARNYLARLRREITELIRIIEKKQVAPGFSRKELKDLRDILKQISNLQINPERGRRKDLKKIDALIGELQSTVERW
jgi:hypothetical protein